MTIAEQPLAAPPCEVTHLTPVEVVLENERYQRLAEIALRQTRRILRNPDDAAEVAQETLANVLRANKLTDIETMGAYVKVAARHSALGFLRHIKVFEALPCADPLVFSSRGHDETTDPSFVFENQTAFGRVGRALKLLEQEFSASGARMLRLTALGKSPAEIGKMFGMTSNAVSAQLYRSRVKLREYLERDEI